MKHKFIYNWVDYTILFLVCLMVLLIPNNDNGLPIIGFSIIILTLYLLFKVRKTKILLLLLGIVGFINISIGLTDLINKGIYVAKWQIPLRFTSYNNYLANSILLFLAVLNIILSYTWINRNKEKMHYFIITKRYNRLISYIGLIIMYLILFATFRSSMSDASSYVSNSNPLYEYAIIIFVVVWFYSGRNKFINSLLIAYSFIYIIQSFFYGDRSAAFLMVLTFFSLYLINKITLPKLFMLAILAIFVSNIVAEIRTGNTLNFVQSLQSAIERGIYSDTASFAYYASITITALNNVDKDITMHFFDFIESVFFGSKANQYSNLSKYASKFTASLYNVGGGFYQSYFYAWFGYKGVIVGSSLLGIIIRFFFSKSKEEYKLYQVLILSFSLRWYLYGPMPLFRSILFIFTILLITTTSFDVLFRGSKIKLLNNNDQIN